MNHFCIFAGTTEGRNLAEFLCAQGALVTVCVATEYGKSLLPAAENLTVSDRPLSQEEIRTMLHEKRFDLVIDATHPYAAHITENVFSACAAEGIEYLRLYRPGKTGLPEAPGLYSSGNTAGSSHEREMLWADGAEEAVELLRKMEGTILLTTGTKDLEVFSLLPGFSERVYARVLPMEKSLQVCRKAGLPPSHILAMQGPFSEEMNKAMLRAAGASILVTKDSGIQGGFDEKTRAAAALGISVVVIGRPPQREGMGYEEMTALLCERYGFGKKGKRDPASIVTQGLPDEWFLRIDQIPMTKREVRAVCLSALTLTRSAVCWDVGAGTGSVAVEMGRAADLGEVYAIEQREDAAELIRENAIRLGAENVSVVRGKAPKACEALPAPTHAFIGGSSGCMAQILELLLHKNPQVRIVATAVTLETAARLTDCLKRFAFRDAQVLSLQVSRSREAGGYHLMTARNLVYIFVMQA